MGDNILLILVPGSIMLDQKKISTFREELNKATSGLLPQIRPQHKTVSIL
jgi:hypothetical protein